MIARFFLSSAGAALALLLAGAPTGAATVNVFALTTTSSATYATPSGAIQPMPATALSLTTKDKGMLVVTFHARGTVKPSGSAIVPIVFIQCRLDGTPCQPGQVEFLYPQFCCDSRGFQWVAKDVAPGAHKVEIYWGMGNPTMAVVTARTLTVEAVTP